MEAPDATLAEPQADPIVDAYSWPRCWPAPRHASLDRAAFFVAGSRAPRRCDWPCSACAVRPRASRLAGGQGPRRPARVSRPRRAQPMRGLRRARGPRPRTRSPRLLPTARLRVTDQQVPCVHSVDPPHAAILCSIELVATEVAGAGAGSATRLRPPPTFLPPWTSPDRHHPPVADGDSTEVELGNAPGDPLDFGCARSGEQARLNRAAELSLGNTCAGAACARGLSTSADCSPPSRPS